VTVLFLVSRVLRALQRLSQEALECRLQLSLATPRTRLRPICQRTVRALLIVMLADLRQLPLSIVQR